MVSRRLTGPRVTGPTDKKVPLLMAEEIERSLAVLELGPSSTAELPMNEQPQDPIFEADSGSAAHSQPMSPAAEAKTVRDAFGNRRRVDERGAEKRAPQDRKVMVEMYGLPKDLAEQVLSGALSMATARRIQNRRAGSDKRMGNSPKWVRLAILGAAIVLAATALSKMLAS